MNKSECLSEKISSRAVGLLILPLALLLGFIGFIIVPVLGAFFALPLFALSGMFLFAPESRVCRLILRKDEA